jgi:hypothetical protein
MQKISSRINRSVLGSTLGPLVCVGFLAAPSAASAADFSGVWMATTPRSSIGANQPELMPRARADLDSFDPLSDPVIRCVPPGFPRTGLVIYPFEIVQTEELVVFLYEVFGMVRRIRIDGGPPPDYLPPARTGYSVGHWEQDELVIDTTHVESGLLTGGGVAQYGDVSVFERYRLSEDGQTLAAEVTITAPETFVAPWTRHFTWELDPDGMIFDAPCDPADSRF